MPDHPTRTFPPADRPTADPPPPDGPTPDLNGATAGLPGEPADSPPPPAPPGYELLEEIGSGGMGTVYRARELALSRHVAVKFLQPRFPADGAAAARFVEEAQITGQLQHPGVPPVHAIGTLADGRPFLVMKLIKGRTLEDLLKERQDPAADRGRFHAVFEQVCHAVACAHEYKVIHRDLKPANVMVGKFGEVQVMDWGLAKLLTAPAQKTEVLDDAPAATVIRTVRESEGSFTVAGSVLGTPAFMPPEQAGGEIARIDERSDVFGLGAILCVILTGKPPFVAKDSEAIRLMAIRGQLADCLARLDGCGAEPELVALAKRCLATDPADRPRHAGEVAKAVAGLRADAEDRAKRAELDRAAAEVRAAEQRKRRKVQAALGLAFTALVVLGGVFLWWTQEQRRARDADERERRLAKETEARDRRAAAEREVSRAVEDAVAKFGRATGAGRDPGLWAEARAAALHADARAAEAEASPEVRDRTRRLVAEIEQVGKNRRLVAALLEIHAGMGDTLTPGGDQDFAGADARYTRAFHDYGADLFALSPEQGADLLRGLGGDVRVDLAAAIDDWGYLRFYLSRQKLDDPARLFRVTKLLDPDPVRNRVRDIVAAGDGAALGRLAGELDPAAQPVQTVNLVAVYLYWLVGNTGDGPRAAGVFLQKSQPHHPGDFQINHNLAFFLNRGRRYAAALPYTAAAVAVRPGSAVAWQDHAIALAGLGRTAEAAAAYRRITALSPDAAYAYRGLVDLLIKAGDREGADAARRELNQAIVRSSREAVGRKPKDASAHYYLGKALVSAGQIEEAVVEYRKAVRLDGDHHGAAIGELANLLSGLGNWEEAIEVYLETIRIAPGYFPAHFGLGNALLAKRDYAGAAAAFRAAIRLDPKHAVAHNQLGNALVRERDVAAAIAEYREAVRLDAKNAAAHNNLAGVLAIGPDGVRDGKEAVEYATKACELTGWKEPRYIGILAAAYAEAGDFDKAVEYQKKALTFPAYEKQYGAQMRKRLDLYTHRKPYRDPALIRREVAPPPRAVGK